MLNDPLFRRLAGTASALCVIMAAIALGVSGVRAAAGVVGGGVLIGLSFLSLGSGTKAMLARGGQERVDRPGVVRATALRLVARYALLGFLAYVMIARLRLHPLGLLAGASSIPAAAFVEAVRLLTKKPS